MNAPATLLLRKPQLCPHIYPRLHSTCAGECTESSFRTTEPAFSTHVVRLDVLALQ